MLFRVGDVAFRRGELLRMLRAAGTPSVQDGEEQARALLQLTYHQEIILQHGVDPDALPQEELAHERERVVAELAIERQLRAQLAADEDRIVRHHARNRGRFSTPIRLWLTRARFPDVSPALAAELESAVAALDGGSLTLEALVAEHGGTIDRLEGRTARQLRAEDPRAMRFAFALAPGQHAPPYSVAGALQVLRVDERREAEPAPLEAVRAAVVEDLYRQQSGTLYTAWRRQVLDEHGFAADHDRLAHGARLLARLPT